jgi:hypothetical protein
MNKAIGRAIAHVAEFATVIYLEPISKRDERIDRARLAVDVTITPNSFTILPASSNPRPSSIPRHNICVK